MAPTTVPSPSKISNAEFTALLNEYPSLVDTISQSKGSKPGQKSLRELDEYRYGTAVADFGSPEASRKSKKAMTLEDVKRLVEWKLRHGKFRPTLMSLAASNNPDDAQRIIAAAIDAYRDAPSKADDGAIAAALAGLTKLRGIGPATASLLLTVHDPERIIFFSDEAFYWLCGGGKVTPIKYNNKEYEMLRQRADELIKRLGVSATDVEKVAYVLSKRDAAASGEKGKAAPKAVKATESPAKDTKAVKEAPTKRKTAAVRDEEPAPGTRRSKRVKK